MVAPYRIEGEAFRAETPRLWAKQAFKPRLQGWDFALYPDGDRVALAPETDRPDVTNNRAVFVFNLFDELRRLVPVSSK